MPTLLAGSAIVIVTVALLVSMLVGTWVEANPALQLGEAFAGVAPDEWQPFDIGDMWNDAKGDPLDSKSRVLYPLIGLGLTGIAGLAMIAIALLGIGEAGRSRADPVLAATLLLGCFLITVGGFRILANWTIAALQGEASGLRVGWLVWTFAFAGLIGSVGAAGAFWRTASHPTARGPRLATLVALLAIFLVIILPTMAVSNPSGSRLLDHGLAADFAVDATGGLKAASALFNFSLVLLWAAAFTNLLLALYTTLAPKQDQLVRSLRLLTHMASGFIGAAGLVLAVVSLAVLPETASLGYVPLFVHAVVSALAARGIIKELRGEVSAGAVRQVQT